MSDVNLTISKEVVAPIVQAKIQEAVIAALGGSQQLVESLIKNILTQKVNSEGRVSTSSYDNKNSWLDHILTKQIEVAVRQELESAISEASLQIKDSLIKQLRTKRGADVVASALIDSLNGTLKTAWRSQIKISFEQPKD